MMSRVAPHVLLVVMATLAPGCFGDNDVGGSLQISAPDELDGGDAVDVTITVRGKANEQFAVAVDSPSGTFAPQSKVVITGDNGEGSFVTRYTVDNKAAIAEITANASSVRLIGESVTKRITVYEVARVGNVAPIATTFEEIDYLTAYPLEVPTPGTLRKLAIVAPAAATALLGLYTNAITIDGDAPGMALARTTATLAIGANEIEVPAQSLAAGTYWMLVTYNGKTTAARGATTVTGRILSPYAFSLGLPDTMPAMTLSTNMGKRNFYIVVRK
jgi:hypothetical protein